MILLEIGKHVVGVFHPVQPASHVCQVTFNLGLKAIELLQPGLNAIDIVVLKGISQSGHDLKEIIVRVAIGSEDGIAGEIDLHLNGFTDGDLDIFGISEIIEVLVVGWRLFLISAEEVSAIELCVPEPPQLVQEALNFTRRIGPLIGAVRSGRHLIRNLFSLTIKALMPWSEDSVALSQDCPNSIFF